MPVNYSFSQGGLPGILSTTAISGSPFVQLNEVNGDGGLSEAVRIYWAIKSLTVTATADATFSVGSSPVVFTHDVEYPGDTSTLSGYLIAGFIVGTGFSFTTPTPTQYVEPPFRLISNVSELLVYPISGSATEVISATFPVVTRRSGITIELRYIAGRYRMYAQVDARGQNQNSPASPVRYNAVNFYFGTPSGDPNTDSQTGTVSILGYNFDYVCEARCGDTAGTATINSQSLTITSSSW